MDYPLKFFHGCRTDLVANSVWQYNAQQIRRDWFAWGRRQYGSRRCDGSALGLGLTAGLSRDSGNSGATLLALALQNPGAHETIYRSLYIPARGAMKKELLEHFRRFRTMRRPRHHTLKTEDCTNIRDAVSISERPATAEDRAIPGHWEGDLLYGNATSQIATLVERQSRFVMLVKVASKNSEAVIDALIRHASKLPRELYKSLTWDRGSEMADHHRFSVSTDIELHFCDPQHPWQRGSNENTNGLLRQYIPKSTDLSAYSQARLDAIARRLNERPRKTLNFDTPAERFNQIVASTG